MIYAPIALFAYNRLEHIRHTVDALSANEFAKNSDLFIFSDGYKDSASKDRVLKVREYLRSIEGFKKIQIIERDKNFGLARSIESGIGQVLSDYDRVIVVEDDLIVSPDFLSFLNTALQVYHNCENVFQISGYMYPGEYGNAAFFLPVTSCWGWATWRRAWKNYDPMMNGYSALSGNKKLRHRFDLSGSYNYFDMATQQKDGLIQSWGICWYLTVFMHDGLVLYPPYSFVRNIGVDGSGTHGMGNKILQLHPGRSLVGNGIINMPSEIVAHQRNLSYVIKLLLSQRKISIKGLLNWLQKKIL